MNSALACSTLLRPFAVAALLLGAVPLSGVEPAPFGIHVVDEATGRGVPLVILETTNHLRYVTDSAGWVAFSEPGLMGRKVHFSISGAGYAITKDSFGYAGVALVTEPGDMAEVKVMRTQVAERMYRVTGQGIYADSQRLGKETPLPQSVMSADVMGQDSVQVAEYEGRLFWIWGDTNRPGYPLGNFHSTGAWSNLPKGEPAGLDPTLGVHLEYLVNEDDEVRQMLPMEKPGPVWLFGLLNAQDASGGEHLIAHYSRMKSLSEVVEQGLAEWDDAERRFMPIVELGAEFDWQHPRGTTVQVAEKGQKTILYFAAPFCVTRVRADYDDVQIPSTYEALTFDPKAKAWAWQREVPPLTQAAEAALIKSGKMPASEARFQIVNAASGKPVLAHAGSVRWNAHRERWVMIFVQSGADESFLGEVWYAESKSVDGPWEKAVKVATHPKYSFYNPQQHDFMDQENGRYIYFEGTYAETFSGAPVATPRYDYNQLMYRLDLDDPRLEPAHVE
ncbi:MAG: hypothetical protein H7A55_13550 [Verrucomicrobiaceae bacterium]|nr:hypothetical protein [Verrucomicrobiaceae bacterium]